MNTSALTVFKNAVRADHQAARVLRERYPTDGPSMEQKGLLLSAVTSVGFQMLIAVRLMRLFRDLPIPGMAKVMSRLIRHMYGAEIHWNAELAPGITLVHGTGLVLSHSSVVGEGCVLFQHVTLGESMHAERRVVGSPTLGVDVHVMPGAVLLGPIAVGNHSKIGANAVVDHDVDANTVVRSPQSESIARRVAS